MKAVMSATLLMTCSNISTAAAQGRAAEIKSVSFTDLRPKVAPRPDGQAVVNSNRCVLGRADAQAVFKALTWRAVAHQPLRWRTIDGEPALGERLLFRFEQDRGHPFFAVVPRLRRSREGMMKIAYNGSFVRVPAKDIATVYEIVAHPACGKEMLR